MTREALLNALCVAAALGGSTNYVIHTMAIARRACCLLTLDDIDQVNKTTPLIAEIAPNGPYSVVDLDRAGGIPAVMRELKPLLNLDPLTVTGRTVGENLQDVPEGDRTVIHPLNQPVQPEGGIVLLRGNLAPGGAIVKRSAVPPEQFTYAGPARVFESEQDCILAIEERRVKGGEVLVVRYEGPKGGPGMREMHRLSNRLKAMQQPIALVTDGRFSGADSGLMIGHVTPEAVEKGPIGIVQDGDRIEIDLQAQRLHLAISDEELKSRLEHFTPRVKEIDSDLLAHYRDEVGCAAEGAIW